MGLLITDPSQPQNDISFSYLLKHGCAVESAGNLEVPSELPGGETMLARFALISLAGSRTDIID